MLGKGMTISKKRVIKILKANNCEAKYGRKKLVRNVYTNKDERYIAENLTKGVVATAQNQVCHTDFTELKYDGGKLYVSGIIDAYARTAVLKWGDKASKELARDTIGLLSSLPEILHSDRGSQYTSNLMREYCEANDIKRSMSAPYCSRENAYIESFWKTLKIEIGETKHLTKYELIMVLEYWIDYYNNERIHSSINYLTPVSFATLSRASPTKCGKAA